MAGATARDLPASLVAESRNLKVLMNTGQERRIFYSQLCDWKFRTELAGAGTGKVVYPDIGPEVHE